MDVAGVAAAAGAVADEDGAHGLRPLLAMGVVVAAHVGGRRAGAHVDGDHVRVRQEGVVRLARVDRLGAHRRDQEGEQRRRRREQPDGRHLDQSGCWVMPRREETMAGQVKVDTYAGVCGTVCACTNAFL